ncbi:MAG TPA: hypothetical protein VGK58_12725 [Lacipirellulaceae bacterium]
MPKRHGAREQKRLAKQKAKRDAKRRQLAMRNSPNPMMRLKEADRWPIFAALVPGNLWTEGIGNLIIARSMPDGQLACGVFLLDAYCLGIKEALWKILSPGEFKELRKQFEEHGRLEDTPPEYFAKLVYRAVDYAQSLGFPPHRDFRHAARLLDGIDVERCPDEFEFGKDGRPFYVQGPSESMEKVRAIATRVAAVGGDYLLAIEPSELSDFEIMDELDDDIDAGEFEEDETHAAEWPTDDPTDEQPRRRRWLPWRWPQ